MSDPDLIADWAYIWQSERAALAEDREWPAWSMELLTLWTALAHGRPGAPAGSSPAMAAPDITELQRRIAELERRLDSLDPP